jgi:FAD:protein FMN transferase
MNPLRNIFGKKKPKVLTWFVISLFLLGACTNAEDVNQKENLSSVQEITGETQGTTYGIKIVDSPVEISKEEIDSILHDFDLSLSGYISESTVSRFNAEKSSLAIAETDKYFISCFQLSRKVFNQTTGAFDPSVLPLMKIWGFLKDQENIPSQSEIDSVLHIIGFSHEQVSLLDERQVEFKAGYQWLVKKKDERINLDFNGIAQGYAVDVLADYIRKKGCKNFYVEIGGEIYVEGKNPEGKEWRLGVDKPEASNDGKNQRVISAVISVTNKGIATSGNYRKFYEKGGKIYAHTLDPHTGRPAENELLSVTVVAKSAAIADAFATAFMVMGLEKSKEYLKSKDVDKLEVLFIYAGEGNALKSHTTDGMEQMLK